jgi:hypothetical protein
MRADAKAESAMTYFVLLCEMRCLMAIWLDTASNELEWMEMSR